MKVVVVLFSFTLAVMGRPQSPNYLPPTNGYLPPSNGNGVSNGQSNTYLPPTNGGYAPSNGGYAPSNGGYPSNGQEEQYPPASYQFKYDVQDAESGNDFGHEEAREGDVATGKYYVLLPDGRRQIVEYVADSEGYKPIVRYEQVGNGNGNGYQNGGYPSNGHNGY